MTDKKYYLMTEDSMSYFRDILVMAELKNVRASEKLVLLGMMYCVTMMVTMLVCMYIDAIEYVNGASLTWVFGLMAVGSATTLYFTARKDAQVARERADAVVDDALFKANVKAEVQSMTDTNNLIGGV